MALLAPVGLAACGSSATTAPLKGSQVLTADAATRTVHLLLASSATGAFNGFNFDGYGGGAMTVSVPAGWTVEVTCRNDSTVLTHSCAIVPDTPLVPLGLKTVFGATSAHPTIGLPFGATAHFSFVPDRVGRYRIACLVTAHETDGMWDWFVVTRGGRPSVRT